MELCYTKIMQRKTFAFIALAFIVWRLLLFIPVFVAEKKIDHRKGYEYTSIVNARNNHETNLLDRLLLSPWANFDGLHYLTIASNGYTNNYGFFPLYPTLIAFFSFLLGANQIFDSSYFFSGFIISNICFFLALVILYKLVSFDYPEKQRKIIILSVLSFPTSFFFGSIYSESLFLLLLLLSFYFARKKQWLTASFFGTLLTLTRLVGICILPALLYEFYKTPEKSLKKFLKSGIWITPFGLIGYSIYNYIKQGDFLYFIQAQGNFLNNRSVNGIVLFPQTIYRYIKILFTTSNSYFEWYIALLELLGFLLAISLLVLAWKKKVRISYIIFSLSALLIPASTGTFTGIPRYILVAFPIYIVFGLIKNKFVKFACILFSSALLFILTILFIRGYYIS